VATTGIGVFDTLKKITKLVLENARAKAVARSTSATPPAPEESLLPAGVIAGVPANVGPREPSEVKHEPVAAMVSAAPQPIEQETPAAVGIQLVGDRVRSDKPAPIHRAPSLKVRQSSLDRGGHKVYRAQKSLKVRAKQKSFFARLFGRLFGW
jgi:hypothetical protein